MSKRTLWMALLAHHDRVIDPVPAPIALADDVLTAPVSLETIEIPAAANDMGSGGGVRITAVTATGALPQGNVSIVGTVPSQRIRIERAGLAPGSYTGTYSAELVSDPTITATGDFTLVLTSTALSSIIVTAPTPVTVGEGDSSTRNVAFIVSRQGDLSQACSVQWTLEGDLNAADMATGQVTSGSLSWAANDGTARTVTIVVKGDTTVETNEVCRIRLSSPVGCTIGTATAAVTIQNDDAAPGGFDQSLPWGGTGMGAVCLFGQPGNQRTASFTVVQMMAEHTGSINRVAWYNKFNTPIRTGYSTGNGGRIKWTLRKITSAPGVRPIALSSTVVSTPEITDPVLAASWNAAFAAAGGSGSVAAARFHEFPTLFFDPPLAVQAGDLLAFTHAQLNSGSGTVSINDAYSTKRVDSDWSPFDHQEHARVFKNGSLSETREEHFPELLYGYTDGMICGNPHMGYANGNLPKDQEVLIIGGTAGILVRQVIPMPSWANGKRIRRVHAMMVRYDNTTSANIRCRIRKADNTTDGELLATATLVAAPIRFETDIKGTTDPTDPIPFLAFDFGTEGPLLASGTTYYVELSTTGGSGTTRYMGDRLQRYIDITPHGLKVPSGFSPGFRGERKTGSAWASMQTNGSQHDIPVWVEFA